MVRRKLVELNNSIDIPICDTQNCDTLVDADSLYNGLHNMDDKWTMASGEDDTWTFSNADCYDFILSKNENSYDIHDTYSGHHFEGKYLDDFLDYIAYSRRILDSLIEVYDNEDSLNASKLNASKEAPIDPKRLARDVLLEARNRVDADGLQSCTWGRPTVVNKGSVIVKRKKGETDEELQNRKRSLADELEESVSDVSDIVVTQTLFLDKEWVTKMALQLTLTEGDEDTQEKIVLVDGVRKPVAVTGTKVHIDASFFPNHDPEHYKKENAKDVDKRKPHSADIVNTAEFDVIDSGNLTSDYSRVIMWVAQELQKAVISVFKHPPKRLVERMFKHGLIKVKKRKIKDEEGNIVETILDDEYDAAQWLSELPKVSAFELIRQGYVPGRDILKLHPEWANELLAQDLVDVEDIIKRKGKDTSVIYNLVKKGQISPERAVKMVKDDKFTERLIREGFYTKNSGTESTDVDDLVQAVQEGNLTYSKAWELNPKTLFPMLAQGVITPKEAYRLDPNKLAEMLRRGYVKPEEAQKLSPQIKRRFTSEEWESLKSSLKQRRRGRTLNACCYENFEKCVECCDDPVVIGSLERVGDYESNPFDRDNLKSWFEALDDEAKDIVFTLVVDWLTEE